MGQRHREGVASSILFACADIFDSVSRNADQNTFVLIVVSNETVA